MSSQPPITTNTCTDPGDSATQNVQIENFCIAHAGSYDQNINSYCNQYGGTYDTSLGPNGEFTEPEWVFSSNGGDFSCDYDDCNNGWLASGGGCCGTCCGITGVTGFCKKQEATGDPLVCCLRDYQCNGSGNISGSSCFSDDNLNSTCNKDFRATDTPYCNYLLLQMCLGNIDGLFNSLDDPANGLDFTSLWVDPQDPITNQNWNVSALPENTKFLTSDNVIANNYSPCTLNNDGKPTKSTKDGGTCNLSTWAPGQAGQYGPQTYLPKPTAYDFGNSNLPPCQQIFWRTLYGNQPTFRNNNWAPASQLGLGISENTSVPPQNAACGILPFQGSPTPEGEAQAGNMLRAAVKKFTTLGNGNVSIINSLVNGLDQPFSEWVFSVCSNYPGLCQDFLESTCSSVTDEELLVNPLAQQWCGCYLSNDAYGKYTSAYGVEKECTPYCNAGGVIPSYNPETGEIKTCQQSTCIIDEFTLDLAKTRVSGGINFNQICNSCSPNGNSGVNSNSNTSSSNLFSNTNSEINTNTTTSISCTCLMDNVNLTTIGASINGGINISQACNGNSKCFSSVKLNGANETRTEVDCHGGTLNSNDVIAKAEAALLVKAKRTSDLWIIFIFLIVILIIVAAWIIIGPGKSPTSDITFTKEIAIPEMTNSQVSQFSSYSFYSSGNGPQKAKFF
jgi:hypothetical protein